MEVMAMVILLPFLSLEGQTSYPIEDKPWPSHNFLWWEMEGCGQGFTHSFLRGKRADLLFSEAMPWSPHSLP